MCECGVRFTTNGYCMVEAMLNAYTHGTTIAGVSGMSTSKPFLDFFKAFTENSCGAVNFRTLEPDTTGFGLEIYPEKRREFDHKPTYNELLKFYEDNRTLFEQYPDLRLGWDRNELNIGVVSPFKYVAMAIAARLDQRAIYDIRNMQEIDTLGTGQRTEFPEYPFETRLQNLKGDF